MSSSCLLTGAGLLVTLVLLPSCLCSITPHFRVPQGNRKPGHRLGVLPNPQPVIGVLDQPWSNASVSYIAASYVKFLEMAGARVVPLHWNSPIAELQQLFPQLNGVLFTGGAALVLESRIAQIYQMAVQANAGDVFPLWGTCLGFELMQVAAANTWDVRCSDCFSAENIALPLNLTAAAKSSTMFSMFSPALLSAIKTQPITPNYHTSGIPPSSYQIPGGLQDIFTVLATNVDPENHEFVSAIEGINLPFLGTQFHPEKCAFEWSPEHSLAHTSEAVRAAQAFADVFVMLARQSSHRFPTQDAIDAAVIENCSPVPDPSGYFDQIYAYDTASGVCLPSLVALP
eukprot:RCo054404